MMITAIVMIVQFTIANIIILYPQSAARRCDRPRWESAREGVGQQKIQPVQVSVIIDHCHQHNIQVNICKYNIQVNICWWLHFGGERKAARSNWKSRRRHCHVTGEENDVTGDENKDHVCKKSVNWTKRPIWLSDSLVQLSLRVSLLEHIFSSNHYQNDGDGDGGNAMIAITDICPDSCWPCQWGVSADGQ